MKDLLAPPGLCVEIALPLPLPNLFSYSVPAELESKIKRGVRVRVPFRNREIVGYLVGQDLPEEGAVLKPLLDVLDEAPVLSPRILELTQWMSDYYGCSWGEAIENALPRWVKYGRKDSSLASPPTPSESEKKTADLNLSQDQKKAFEIIQKMVNEREAKKEGAWRPILLYGVTGSGKSEIYIRAIRETLGRNQSAICLVPEIALTEQLRRFFLQHFGRELEILHSKMSDGERFLAWKRLENGERNVALGPRSAVFAPMKNLGLLIIDEEHEGSYKQETSPRYHAREVAVWRARHEKALLIMGSATPSLESMRRAERGEILRIDLATRIDDKSMPRVQIIDLKEMTQLQKKAVILSPRLAAEIDLNLKKKEGTLLLLNRRGFSTYIHCPQCRFVEHCPSCQVSLTFHQEDERLLCHYCNYSKPVANVCDQCRSPLLRFAGFGTEKVESEVAAKFPGARIARMDADSVRKKGSHEKILSEFRNQKIDILIGTQMIAKGFDFPHVTLVGVILADVGLMLPDFRSSERTFQLLTQVAGRAGRGKLPGRVIVQTFSPDHPSIRHAKEHDYLSFYHYETAQRIQYHYPPDYSLINFILRSRTEQKAYQFARHFRDALLEATKDLAAPPEIIGPAPLPFYKLRGHFRWHVMIKSSAKEGLAKWAVERLGKLKRPSQVAVAVDVDPLNIL